jgi:hypothetical protein
MCHLILSVILAEFENKGVSIEYVDDANLCHTLLAVSFSFLEAC